MALCIEDHERVELSTSRTLGASIHAPMSSEATIYLAGTYPPSLAKPGSTWLEGMETQRVAQTKPNRRIPPDDVTTRKLARVFMTGRSQAVRLPKEFRFDTDRVAIRRDGCHVILSPLFEDWEDYFERASRATSDFEAATDEMRRCELPIEHRETFD